MKIIEAKGSIFDCPAEVLVNPVNCEGVMGAGLAREFAKRFPTMEQRYNAFCADNQFTIGEVFVVHIDDYTTIICFPTKKLWRNPSKIDYIQKGLVSLVAYVENTDTKTIAIPALGCGLGGLKWQEVKPLIVEAFKNCPEVTVYLFAPQEER